jgi:hypothetical protein
MASTYSQYKIELVGTGEQAGTWGTTTNNNFGSATPGTYQGFEQAIGGRADVTMSGTTTLSLTNSNAAQDARALYLNLSGTLSGAADLVVPALQKSYLVKNGTTGGFAVTIKVTGQTGVSIPNGKTVWVYNNGTDIVTAVDFIPEIATTTVDATNIEVTNIKAKDGTSAGSIADSTGVVTLASSVLTTTDINGGTIDGAVIGGASADAGSFTTLNTSGAVVFNDAGADVDFRVEGDTDANLLFVDASTDRVGIGTSTPSGKFEVSSASAGVTVGDFFVDTANKTVYVGRLSSTAADNSSFIVRDRLDSVLLKVDTQNLNVGIGTSSPAAKLHVNSGATAEVLRIEATTNPLFSMFNAGTREFYIQTQSVIDVWGQANKDMRFGTNDAERMRITSSGNVGIGTTTAAAGGLLTLNRAPAAAFGTPMLQVGGASFTSGGYYSVGLGYTDATYTEPPAEIAFVITTDTGGTNGSIVFGTRSVTTNTAVTERMRIDSSGQVIVGPFGGNGNAVVAGSSSPGATNQPGTNLLLKSGDGSGSGFSFMTFSTSPAGSSGTTVNTAAERARITSGGQFLVGKTADVDATAGTTIDPSGLLKSTVDGSYNMYVNRLSSDGTLVYFAQANTVEGEISVSGSTVSYLGGHLSRWAQMLTKPDLVKGTVMSNLDEMNVYVKPTLYWTEDDELPVDEEGNPTVAVGDLKQETSVSENEQLNKVKVSDVEGDPNVAGVFVNWTYDEAHQVDEINMAMTGDMIIRIAEGVTVARGDLLMSAGDGTAKPQGDDIVRSKTIAKVTSTHVTCTYDDGSYCVPCVLMAC